MRVKLSYLRSVDEAHQSCKQRALAGNSGVAVPTGIVTAELTRSMPPAVSGQACPNCGAEGHDRDAKFCKYCGAQL